MVSYIDNEVYLLKPLDFRSGLSGCSIENISVRFQS